MTVGAVIRSLKERFSRIFPKLSKHILLHTFSENNIFLIFKNQYKNEFKEKRGGICFLSNKNVLFCYMWQEDIIMGTTKSGRLINTIGSRGSASQFAVIHSNEGAYTIPRKGNHIRLKSGGHGQAGMNELNIYGIKYKVEKTYPNGVRVGHILNHTNKAKTKSMGQSWFPKNWTSKDIKHAGEHVANLKRNRRSKDGSAVFGMWKGVRVGIIRTHGQIATIFPDSKQPYAKRRKNR